MTEKIVASIHLTSAAPEPMRGVAEAHAVPGRGPKGDRYSEGRGKFSGSPDTEITLAEAEAVEALAAEVPAAEHGLPIDQGETRRYMIPAYALELEATGRDHSLGFFDHPAGDPAPQYRGARLAGVQQAGGDTGDG